MRPKQTETAPVLLWFRQDLRLADQAALRAAVATGRPVLPVFVLDEETPGPWAPGGAARWWLHHSLAALGTALAARGAPLVLRRGRWEAEIPRLVAQTGAAELHAGRMHEPWAHRADAALARTLGIRLHLHRTATLHDPEAIRTKTGGVYAVYTPFARTVRARPVPPPEPAPARIRAPAPPPSDRLEAWGLLPTRPDWADGLRAAWTPGEAGAARRLASFQQALAGYGRSRDLPGEDGTSRLSPHLHWGEISPAQLWHAATHAAAEAGTGLERFHGELLWREFSAHLLAHHPHMPERPLRPAFAALPFRPDPEALRAWQRGRTGIPIVDAGMRQLWRTGWMHNRVRMIAASFLVKQLLVSWQEGEAWFWDTLVDADLASNSANWQWVAGSGIDAQPFFRIFNPVSQGRRFDPSGAYVRAWVPELAPLPDAHLHAPWEAPEETLSRAGIAPGRTYPHPVVDLRTARARALDAWRGTVRGAA